MNGCLKKKMSRFVLLFMAFIQLCLSSGCSSSRLQKIYPYSFVERFADRDSLYGSLVIPCGKNRFVIMEESVIYDVLYHKDYQSQYLTYENFLLDILNNQDSAIIKDKWRLKGIRINTKIQKEGYEDFDSFSEKYTYGIPSMDTNILRVKNQYSQLEDQIIRVFFNNGYYIFWDCYEAHYVLSVNAECLPPSL